MVAIMFSMESGSENNAKDAIAFMKNHDIMAWGTNINISTSKFKPSENNPLQGFINYESNVRYAVKIIEIIKYKLPQHYPNAEERPENWRAAKWKTFLRLKEFESISPIETTSFKKRNGENVKHPPQNYVEVLNI